MEPSAVSVARQTEEQRISAADWTMILRRPLIGGDPASCDARPFKNLNNFLKLPAFSSWTEVRLRRASTPVEPQHPKGIGGLSFTHSIPRAKITMD